MSTVPRRILVVANETAAGAVLPEAVDAIAAGGAPEVLVVAPALNSRLAHWTSNEDGARRAAESRLACCLDGHAAAGLEAEGCVGDADPLRAVEDALRLFPADHVVVATHPEGRSNWLARDVVERARDRFGLPVVHIVVDLAAAREYVAA
jgi:GABA permease